MGILVQPMTDKNTHSQPKVQENVKPIPARPTITELKSDLPSEKPVDSLTSKSFSSVVTTSNQKVSRMTDHSAPTVSSDSINPPVFSTIETDNHKEKSLKENLVTDSYVSSEKVRSHVDN